MKSTPRCPSFSVLSAAALALLLAACGTSVPLNAPPAATSIAVQPESSVPAPTAPAIRPIAPAEPANVPMNNAPSAAAPGVSNVVYFDYDSYVIKDEFRSVIDGNAKQLSTQPSKRIVVEGHTDERGGSEYNLALGQKRAEAVVKALTLLGAKSAQIEAVSYGKERPAVEGHEESAWSKNRRAELKGR